MLNSPVHNHFGDDPADSVQELIGSNSRIRLMLVGTIFLLCVFGILVRVAWVQAVLPDRYLSVLEATTTDYELLPARDGRVVADGRVLAVDVEHYSIQVHYRWLQDPPDGRWLQQQIRQRLSREELRVAALVEQAEQEILRQRTELWQHLTEQTSVTLSDLTRRRELVQERVERIAESVNQRHLRKQSQISDGSQGTFSDYLTEAGWLMQAASSVRRALTTTPSRTADARIVVREQEEWHTLIDDVGLDSAAAIGEHPERFPGTRIISTTRRSYPERRLAAHLIGARTIVREDEPPPAGTENIPGADRSSFRRGRFGVEYSYDDLLHGVPGIRRTVRNRRQQVLLSEITRRPRSGRDITLTIDVALQQVCEQLLAEALTDAPRNLLSGGGRAAGQTADDADDSETHQPLDAPSDASDGQTQPVPVGGSIVVMEAASGRVLAAASAPGFDLSLFTNGSPEAWNSANADTRRPFVSRITSMALPPGSTFKMVTAVAGLQTGALRPDEWFDCRGYLQNPDQHRCLIFRHFGYGHGRVNLKAALAHSCNVYFFDAAQRMGIFPLTDWTQRFGFGRLTGIDLPFEKAGMTPQPPAPADPQNEAVIDRLRRRYQQEALGLSIGQSRLSVTPLQMARMMAAIANGGWLVTPHVVADEGVSHHVSEPLEGRQQWQRMRIDGLSEDALMSVREGLIAAVEESGGTGYRTVRLDHVRIGGKTGTAETAPGKPDHAWFTGFAPAEDPQYVFVVVLEHGGSGSHAAGPIAREIVRRLFPVADDRHLSAR